MQWRYAFSSGMLVGEEKVFEVVEGIWEKFSEHFPPKETVLGPSPWAINDKKLRLAMEILDYTSGLASLLRLVLTVREWAADHLQLVHGKGGEAIFLRRWIVRIHNARLDLIGEKDGQVTWNPFSKDSYDTTLEREVNMVAEITRSKNIRLRHGRQKQPGTIEFTLRSHLGKYVSSQRADVTISLTLQHNADTRLLVETLDWNTDHPPPRNFAEIVLIDRKTKGDTMEKVDTRFHNAAYDAARSEAPDFGRLHKLADKLEATILITEEPGDILPLIIDDLWLLRQKLCPDAAQRSIEASHRRFGQPKRALKRELSSDNEGGSDMISRKRIMSSSNLSSIDNHSQSEVASVEQDEAATVVSDPEGGTL